MVAIIIETGSGNASANSYTSAGAANTYHEKHLYSSVWTGASASHDQALMMATRLIDVEFTFEGEKVSDTQALEFPRYNITDRSGFIIQAGTLPTALLDATAEFARLLIAADRTAETDDKGFSRIKAGPLDLDVAPWDRKAVLPPTVAAMLAPFGWPRSSKITLSRA